MPINMCSEVAEKMNSNKNVSLVTGGKKCTHAYEGSKSRASLKSTGFLQNKIRSDTFRHRVVCKNSEHFIFSEIVMRRG